MTDKQPPLDPDPEGKPFGAEVIDLGDIRVQHGRARFNGPACQHRSLTYNRMDRRVWCQDCERTIDGFDGFLTLVGHFDDMLRKARVRLEKADAAYKAVLTRRVAKALDRIWASGMAPGCPHCSKPLLPEDMESVSSTHMEWERTRRAHLAKKTPRGTPDA